MRLHPTVQGRHYHRAGIEIEVTGKERPLYRKAEGLQGYVWNTPAPMESKLGNWNFVFQARFPPNE